MELEGKIIKARMDIEELQSYIFYQTDAAGNIKTSAIERIDKTLSNHLNLLRDIQNEINDRRGPGGH